jgi:hypothetical protein
MSDDDVQPYYVVDTGTLTILDGPFLWDGVSDWTPPTAGTLMLVSDAEAAGYTWP